MGILDMIPGGSVVKNTASAAAGTGVGYLLGRHSTKKQLQELERSNQELKDKLAYLNDENLDEKESRQSREIARVSILKQMAYRDGNFCNKEKIYIYDYIISCSEIEATLKIALMIDLDNAPSIMEKFWGNFEKLYKDKICITDDEIKGFRSVLLELSLVDGNRSDKESEYLDKVLHACGLPIL
jgi:hypothetical protein